MFCFCGNLISVSFRQFRVENSDITTITMNTINKLKENYKHDCVEKMYYFVNKSYSSMRRVNTRTNQTSK